MTKLSNVYQVRNNTYHKISGGVALFNKASAKRVYDGNRPHFRRLADWLTTTPIPQNTQSEEIKQKLLHWENEGDRRYRILLDLGKDIYTEADLEKTIAAENDYNSHLNTYDELFSGQI